MRQHIFRNIMLKCLHLKPLNDLKRTIVESHAVGADWVKACLTAHNLALNMQQNKKGQTALLLFALFKLNRKEFR
jgi:hypothetical protein